MTTSSKTDPLDLTTLAAEACDLWQEHLAAYAQNPEARDAMTRMIEPQRQFLAGMFADYAAMMQNAVHGAPTSFTVPSSSGDATSKSPATGAPSDDVALRLAQLAHRVGQLEHTIANLEQRLAEGTADGNTSTAKTQRPTSQS